MMLVQASSSVDPDVICFYVLEQIPSPEEGEEGVSLYESWHKRDNWTNDRDAPR